MNQELEALLLRAAKATGRGVVGASPQRAHDFGVPVGKLVREGEVIPGSSRRARTTGYYCPRSSPFGTPSACLAIDAHSPGDGWTRYSIVQLDETGTGQYSVSPYSYTLAEAKAFLRGVECTSWALTPLPLKKGR